MKHKKLLSLFATLTSAVVLASCTNTNYRVIFSDTWNTDTTNSTPHVSETLKYSVSFETSGGTDAVNYDLEYANGSYEASLVPLSDKSGYTYTTSLTIDVSYTLGAASATFTDQMNSVVIFKSSGNSLQPISSEKTMLCHAPTNVDNASKLEDCYSEYNYKIETKYEADLSKGTTTITNLAKQENNTDTRSFEIEDEKYTYLDNEQLLFALRGVSPSLNSAPNFLVYAPFTAVVQTIKTTFATTTTTTAFTFQKNGVSTTKDIAYREVSVGIDSKMPGATQTLWIAEKTETLNNSNRNVILQIKTPISYNLGTLVYKLIEETYSI